MYKNCELTLTNYYYISITNTLVLQIKKHVRTLSPIDEKNAVVSNNAILSNVYYGTSGARKRNVRGLPSRNSVLEDH